MDALKEKAAYIDSMMKAFLPESDKRLGRINEAMNYSVLSGGKRLRPIMLIEAFRVFCGDTAAEELLAKPFAAALEFIQCYSLVHDDLPAMDNDMYRRGKLTTHVKFGHAMGILTGDALLNLAFETLADCGKRISREADFAKYFPNYTEAFSIFARKTGYSGMIGGQVIDVTCQDSLEDNAERVSFMYTLKTSALFEAALGCGAALAGASDNDISTFIKAGNRIGLAFQIRDDILDLTSSLETMGKEVQNDGDKNTIAAILGRNEAAELVDRYSAEAIELLGSVNSDKTAFLKELTAYLTQRTY